MKSWSKGLTSATDERVKNRSEKRSKKIKNLNFKVMTIEKSFLLGVLCSDGYLRKSGIGLSVIDKDFIDYFDYCLESVYGLVPQKYFRKAKLVKFPKGHISLCKPIYCSFLYSRRVVKDLLSYDKISKGFKTKSWRVPEEIKKGTDSIKASFIKGFFDSEGCVNTRWVESYSSNYKGLKDVQELLKKINIKSNFRKLNRDYEMYQISIYSKPDQALFLKNVGFSIKRKKEKLIKILHNIKMYKYTPKQYYEVMELFSKDKKIMQISRKTNINRHVIADWVKRDIKPLFVKNKVSQEKISALLNIDQKKLLIR